MTQLQKNAIRMASDIRLYLNVFEPGKLQEVENEYFSLENVCQDVLATDPPLEGESLTLRYRAKMLKSFLDSHKDMGIL